MSQSFLVDITKLCDNCLTPCVLPFSQNADNSWANFIINKLSKQNSQTFDNILSTFFVYNIFLTFDKSLAKFFNNKVPKITN